MEVLISILWPSWRLLYTLCAFFAMVAQQCMSNALNFAVLCMIKPRENETEVAVALTPDANCPLDVESVDRVDITGGEFSWSKHQEWILLSSYFYGYMVVQPIAGRLADKFGGKFFLLAGLIGQAIMFMLIPTMARSHYWLGVTTRLVQGFLAGFAVPSMYQLYTVWAHPDERSALMSFAYGGYAVGALSTFPVSSFLCRFGWTYVFYVIGGASFLLGLLCYSLVYNTLEDHPWLSKKEFDYLKNGCDNSKTVPSIPWKQMFTSAPILAFIVTHVCNSFGIIMLNLVLPRYLSDTMHFNLKENGFYSSAVHVGSITSRMIVMLTFARLHAKSKLSLTVFRRIVFCFGNTVAALSLVAISILECDHRMVIVLLIYVVGAAMDMSFTGAYWVSCLDMAPAFAGLLTGISNSAATLSGILAPIGISHFITEGSKEQWNYLYYSMASAYVVSMFVYGSLGSSEKQPWGDFVAKSAKAEGE